MEIEQRRAPRWPSDWSGQYRLEKTMTWQPCRLIDISGTGVAVEPAVFSISPEPAGWLELELLAPDEEPLRFRGEVRHVTRTDDDRLRVGIDFAGLSQLEANLINLLFGRVLRR